MPAGPLSAWLTATLLVSLRIAPVFAFAPPFTLVRLPVLFRVFFGLGAAGLIMWLRPLPHGVGSDAASLTAAALRELLVGTVVVMAFQLMFGALYMAGRTVDVQAGFGLATLLDPTNNSPTPLIGTLIAYSAGVVFFATGGHAELLKLFSASLDLVPVGMGAPPESLDRLAAFISTVFAVALGVAGANILALFIVDAVIALMSRTLPQMNVLIFGFQAKILVLLALLPLSAGLWGALLARLSRYTLDNLVRLL